MYKIKYLMSRGVYMATQSIFAEQTVSVSEVRKNPTRYFRDEPVAVLSNNKTAGYMISAESYEEMVHIMEGAVQHTAAKFRPSKARMDEIAARGLELLSNASAKDLSVFEE
jgi:antitoxin YafN